MSIKRLTTNKHRQTISDIKNSFINGLTTAQVDSHIDNNITDLSSAKVFLKKLTKVVLYLLKHNNVQ